MVQDKKNNGENVCILTMAIQKVVGSANDYTLGP